MRAIFITFLLKKKCPRAKIRGIANKKAALHWAVAIIATQP
jgi:hypothetical protein